MARRIVPLALLAAAVGPAAPAATSPFDFKTPGEAAHCGLVIDGFRCITPNDGFWIRFNGIFDVRDVQITKGYSPRFKGHRSNARVLRFGDRWASSDAEVIVCLSRATGLTCRNPPSGLTFWLGRYRGHRIYYTTPGYPLRARPLFRTAYDVRCGINLDTLEPDNPSLMCWHAGTGAVAGIAHDDAGHGAGVERIERAKGFRPRRYPLLGAGSQFVWRCRLVDERFAGRGCSPRSGTAVFTCEIGSARVSCANRGGRGFQLGRGGAFDTF